jgi:hypothetical protein
LHKYANRFFLNIEPAGDSKISVTTRGTKSHSLSKSQSPRRLQISCRSRMLSNEVVRSMFWPKAEEVTRINDSAYRELHVMFPFLDVAVFNRMCSVFGRVHSD